MQRQLNSGRVYYGARNLYAINEILYLESIKKQKEADEVLLEVVNILASSLAWVDYAVELKKDSLHKKAAMAFMIGAMISVNKKQDSAKENYALASEAFFYAGDLKRSRACEDKVNELAMKK